MKKKPTIKLNDARQEMREASMADRDSVQCSASYSGRQSLVFCIRPLGHSGDHRAYGAQWSEP